MKTYSLIIAIFASLMVVSCQNETPQPTVEPVNESAENVVVNSSPAVDSDVVTNELSNNDNEGIIEEVKYEEVSQKNDKNEAKLDEKQVKPVEDKEETIVTAEDLSGELDNEVNRQANPDNYNGVADIDTKSSINLVPVFSEKDLNSYYVLIAIKVHKMSKSELSQLFPSSESVYVIQNEGLYKYCLGKFETEAEALSYKKDIDKKYSFKDSQVVTFKQAW